MTTPIDMSLDEVQKLSIRMDRFESHQSELRKDVKQIAETQREMILLLGGSDLNGHKGFIRLMQQVEDKVDIMDKKLSDNQKDIDLTKQWGRFGMTLLGGVLLWILKNVFDKN